MNPLTSIAKNKKTTSPAFSMTSIIDIVFLLIIFFMLVFQFISAESFDVKVPDKISSAPPAKDQQTKSASLTIMQDRTNQITYAVGSQIITPAAPAETSALITAQLNEYLDNIKTSPKTVILRCDKNITYRHVKKALSAIADSRADNIKLAVINTPAK